MLAIYSPLKKIIFLAKQKYDKDNSVLMSMRKCKKTEVFRDLTDQVREICFRTLISDLPVWSKLMFDTRRHFYSSFSGILTGSLPVGCQRYT